MLIATTLSGIAEFENNRRKKDRNKESEPLKGKVSIKDANYHKPTLIQKIKDLKENKKLISYRNCKGNRNQPLPIKF
jgi:hypothetical protein